MPLVILCGIPASGKTYRAKQIEQYLVERHKCRVVLLNEESLGLDKAKAYENNEQEKITRNRFKFEAEKNLNIETVVIVDSMNYIKGYRYQMYCIAREMKTTYCVVFCNASLEQARIFNQKNENRYPEALFEDLVKRLEVPQLKNRWDTPLFERRHDQETPLEEIADVLLFQQKKAKDPVSTKAQEKMIGQDYLLDLDTIVTKICDEIMKQQAERGTGFPITIPGCSEKIILNSQWSVIALKKTRNEFTNVIKGKPIPISQIASSFSAFLRESDKRK